jgi:hypothetical protein
MGGADRGAGRVRLALDLSVARIGHNGGPAFDDDAVALFARMVPEPDSARKLLIHETITILKDGGAWPVLDGWIVEAGHSSQAARLNWKQDLYNLTLVNSPTFAADRGFTGDALTTHGDTGFNPTTAASPKFTRNNGHMGVWIGTNVNGSSMNDMGISSYASINTRNGTAMQVRAMSSTLDQMTLPSGDSIGWSCYTRADANNGEIFRNALTPVPFSRASTALLNIPFYVMASAFTGPVAQARSSRRSQAVHWGGHIDSTKRAAIYAALLHYMTGVGAA